MKLIKLLVTLSLINVLVVVGIAQYMSPKTVVPVASSPVPSPDQVSPIPSNSVVPSSIPQATNQAKSSAIPNSIVATQSPKAALCIIQIDGVSYEITSLRQTHSGGDVFKCGTDMSSLFWKKHDNAILKMMQQYKI